MLEHLFGSKTRVKLLRLFLNNPQTPFFLRELSRSLKSQLNSVRREINNLENLGIVKISTEGGNGKSTTKKFYLTNTDFVLYPELKALMLKAQLLLEQNFVKEIQSLANLQLFILTGIFVGIEKYPTDILLVGKVSKKKIEAVIKDFEKDLGRSINYTIMSLEEFRYRQDITDRFLYQILEGRKIVMVDQTLKK